jgi:sensor histidine kinase regulating citrate/malate metabolism
VDDPALRAKISRIVGQLESGFQRVSRLVEFDVEDEYFEMRSFALRDWLVSMNERYAQNYSPVGLAIDAEEGMLGARVRASEHLLNTIFWNIWVNAHQTVGEACQITVRITSRAPSLCLMILDNGDGFSVEAKEAAFFHAYSGAQRRSGHSGKGLLEVQDAVAQLHGKVELVEQEGHWRMLIRFPEEPT